MIGQRVIYQNVICVVCSPEDAMCADKIWIDNPEKGYKHWVDENNIRPLPGCQL